MVTARNIDTGQLITEGSPNELFHLQATQTLRVYANLPQLYSGNVKRGSKIDLTFAEHPGKTFQGTLVRNADAIDPVSRTLLVEIDIDNRGGELLPGSLAQVHFSTPSAGETVSIDAHSSHSTPPQGAASHRPTAASRSTAAKKTIEPCRERGNSAKSP